MSALPERVAAARRRHAALMRAPGPDPGRWVPLPRRPGEALRAVLDAYNAHRPAGTAPVSALDLARARATAPEHQGLMRWIAEISPSLMPRRHPDDRGPIQADRGYREQAPAGAYSQIVAWSGRRHWLDVVVPAVILAHGPELARAKVSADSLTRWAAAKSIYALKRTGRRCVVRPDVLATAAGLSKSVVQRCNRVARQLGLEVVVMKGRMLTFAEVAQVRSRGSRQRGLSSEVALTVPASVRDAVATVSSDTPTRGTRSTSEKLHSQRGSSRPGGRRDEAAPRLPRRKSGPAHELAVAVARIVPWLTGEGPARLAPTLSRFATATTPWDASDVSLALSLRAADLGLPADPALVRAAIRTRPAALMAALLRTLDPEADHPSAAAFAPEPAPARPCGAPGCDEGWTHDDAGRARACPSCPPAVRRQPAQVVPGWDAPFELEAHELPAAPPDGADLVATAAPEPSRAPGPVDEDATAAALSIATRAARAAAATAPQETDGPRARARARERALDALCAADPVRLAAELDLTRDEARELRPLTGRARRCAVRTLAARAGALPPA